MLAARSSAAATGAKGYRTQHVLSIAVRLSKNTVVVTVR